MKQLILGLVSSLLIAATPAPTGHINDFANIIPDDREAVLEESLRTYEVQTEIEIAVVTTPTLDGKEIGDYSIELARDWGIGKKGADNGVLVVVAPSERKYRIEVGYGLEGYLTDADSSLLAKDALVPAFQAGDYPAGIERLTAALTDHLGSLSPEERAVLEKKASEARKAAAQTFFNSVFNTLLILSAVAGFILLIISVRKTYKAWVRNKQRRKALHEYLMAIDAIPDQLMQAVAQLDLPNLPAWMHDDKEHYELSLEEILEQAGQHRKQMEGLIEVDLDQAEAHQAEVASLLEQAEGYVENLRTIPAEVQRFRQQCEQVVQEAVREIDGLCAHVATLTEKGYRITTLVPSLDVHRLADEKENITTLLKERGEGFSDASEAVHDKASRLLEKVRTLKDRLTAVLETQSSSERRITALKARVEALPALQAEHELRVARLRATTPVARHVSFVEGLPVFERTLTGIAPRLESAIRENSMQVQLFAEAARILDAAEANLRTVDNTVNQAKALEQTVTEAKEQFASKRQSVERAISEAERLMGDSDVGAGAKNRLREAERILQTVTVDAATPDWIAVAALCAQAGAKAKQAVELAQSDISGAERERRRQAEEEERRQRRAEAAAAAAASSASSSSNSSGSFGGFGGGDFGGGGSSGSW